MENPFKTLSVSNTELYETETNPATYPENHTMLLIILQ